MVNISYDDTRLVANVKRGLCMDMIQKANSGHPGMPLGMADVMAILTLKHLKYNPQNSRWLDRDRLIFSGGHGSSLLYSFSHLAGYGLSLEELKNFRQWGSRTPGHPEYGLTPGVEATTGPLGQGLANAVGMALAERMLAARFNQYCESGQLLVNHRIYALCGDGDLMEGISHEAGSAAGNLGLENLVVLFDNNGITIEGPTRLTCSDEVHQRFQAYGWWTTEINGHDHSAIDEAIEGAKGIKGRPTLIVCNTDIAHGSPNKQGSAKAHGEPLGEEEVRLTKRALGLPEDEKFYVPARARELYAERAAELKPVFEEWQKVYGRFECAHPKEAREWTLCQEGAVTPECFKAIQEMIFDAQKPISTRAASGQVLQVIAREMPSLIGGSADLGPSNETRIKDSDWVGPGFYTGRNFHYGVREFGSAAFMNGIALHGGYRPYGGTFLVFSDYERSAIRLAAMMGLPVIFVFTHDSYQVGEDGPTHQPVEHITSLRLIPGLSVIRPADANETREAWAVTIANKHGPTAIILTRQKLPVIDREKYAPAYGLSRGAYVLWQSDPSDPPKLIIIGTGSEVHLALAAGKILADKGVKGVRVVSMPSWELFEAWKDEHYKNNIVFPPECKMRVSIEAGSTLGWERYVGKDGLTIGLDHFGASAPAKVLAEEYGFTPEKVAERIRKFWGFY